LRSGLEAFGKFLDSSIRLPGGLRIGWDGIIGLVPGVGDAIGLGLSSWLVWRACQLELPRPVIIRMLLNVGVEAVVGIVPIVGDLFDFVFKANNRNVDDPLLTTEETSSSIAASVKLPRTILLVCDIYGSFQHTFAAALRDAVEPQGYGVLCVTGRALERDAAVDDFAHLYALGASMDVAGVVIMASTLGRILQENQLERFVDRYAHLPAVTVGGRTNLCSSVTGDNTRSMRELARHITEDAHRQQILFLRGHESCPNSRQREAAFREVLSERGIAIDESLFLSCGYSASQAERAVGQLLAQGVAIDAIVAANDAMAFGAEIALERQCLAIPRDVVVSGFDDLELAVNATPPETPHRHITVPGELVIRESSSSLKPLCPVNPVPKNVQAEFAKMGRWHEIVETTHVKLSRWVDRESVKSSLPDCW